MKIPQNITEILEQNAQKFNKPDIITAVKNLSLAYREQERNGTSFIKNELYAAAYSLFRMPCTFGAIKRALELTFTNNEAIGSAIDFACGTGAGALAVKEFFGAEITLIDREEYMLAEAEKFIDGNFILGSAEKLKNIKAPLVLTAYSLNEYPDLKSVKDTVKALWEATENTLIIVDNGTPEAFKRMAEIRQYLISLGANIVAPCTTCCKCKNSWCHFAVRIERSKLLKELKGGCAPFEDEKFTFISACKTPKSTDGKRVLRHPQIAKGKITLTVCENGEEAKITVTKKHEKWAKARKINCGDIF